MNLLRKTHPLLSLLLLPLLLTACGGGDDAPPGNTPSPLPPGTVGAAGGTVTGPAGTQVVIPANALSQNVVITITQTSTGAPPLPNGVVAVGPMFAFEPHGTSFATPATVTLSFDPALVPAGATPVLYKTTAGQAGWEVVPGSTLSGSSMTASVSGFSYMVAGATQPPLVAEDNPWRFWEFRKIMASNQEVRTKGTLSDVRTGPPEPEGDMLQPEVFGGLSLFPAGRDSIASGEIFATANGKTYWAEAEAPVAEDRFAEPETTATGARAIYVQKQSYHKDEGAAWLNLTVTQAFVEAFDFNGSDPVYAGCPFDEASLHCRDILKAEIEFHVMVVTGAQGDNAITRFVKSWQNGMVMFAGFENHWYPQVYFSPQAWRPEWDEYHEFVNPEALPKGKPLWKRSHFTLTDNDRNRAVTYGLTEPLVVPVDLSEVDDDSEFTLDVRVYIRVNNRRARESFLMARLRDPVNFGGVAMDYSGLTPTNRPVLGPITLGEPPAFSPCNSGNDPESGTLQFSSGAYTVREFDTRAPVVFVTRTGGTRGTLRAMVRTSNGTGLAGTHYQQVAQIVEFDDGDDVPRMIGIPVIDNGIENGNVTVNLELTAEENCARIGDPDTAVFTIIDDEYVPPEPGPSGQLDETFGTAGTVTTAPFGGAMSKMIMQADGKFVIVGGTFTEFIAARFNHDGTPDTGFGSAGRVATPIAGSNGLEYARAVAQQADGKLVVAGHATLPNNAIAVALVRYHPDGTLDDSFGEGGTVLEAAVHGQAHAVALQPDGKILIAGSAPVSGGTDLGDMLVARFNADGTLDSSFGTAGITVFDFRSATDVARNLVLLGNGSMIVSGEPASDPDYQTGVAKLDANGVLDPTFGTGGKVSIPGAFVGRGLALQPDNKLVLVGGTTGFPSSFAVVRLNANGTYDTSFGNDGATTLRTSTSTTGAGDVAQAVAVRGDGRLYVAGKSGSINHNFGLVRFNADGSVDTDFGTDGVSIVDFSGLGDGAESVVIQGDGKVVMGGYATPSSNDGYGLARVHP